MPEPAAKNCVVCGRTMRWRKMTLPNERARSVGRHRQLLDFHGYQVHVAITALLAWHHRTGADLSRWFGQWRPPNHAVSAAA